MCSYIHSRLISAGVGLTVVRLVDEYSKEGRAVTLDPAIYTLAVCSLCNVLSVRRAAFSLLPKMCRRSTPQSLFSFLCFRRTDPSNPNSHHSGWGRAIRRAVAEYYNSYADDPLKLAYHVTKYRCRKSWRHKDVVRLAHVTTTNPAIRYILAYVARGLEEANRRINGDGNETILRIRQYFQAVELARRGQCDLDALCGYIAEFQLVREHLPTRSLRETMVWENLVVLMPMKCMLRNIGKMASLQLFGDGKPAEHCVLNFLGNEEKIVESKVHPTDFLLGLHQYRKGSSSVGRVTWIRRPEIEKGLEEGFYLSLGNVESTNKRFLVAVDLKANFRAVVKGEFDGITVGKCISSLVFALMKREPNCYACALGSDTVVPLNITEHSRLHDLENIWLRGVTVVKSTIQYLLEHAIQQRILADVIVVFTADNTTLTDTEFTPGDALRNYQEQSGVRNARLVLVNMLSGGCTLQPEVNANMADIVGFDTHVLRAIQEFARNA